LQPHPASLAGGRQQAILAEFLAVFAHLMVALACPRRDWRALRVEIAQP